MQPHQPQAGSVATDVMVAWLGIAVLTAVLRKMDHSFAVSLSR